MSIDAVAKAISEKIGDNSGFGATVKFDCGDDGVVFVDGASTPNSVTTEDKDADCTIKLDMDVLQGLISGEENPTAAFMSGKLSVEGDMGVAMKLSEII